MLELRSLCIPSIFLFACGGALADDADEYREKLVTRSSPTWSVVGSLEGTYIDNAFFAPSGREGDFYVAPDVTIRLDGELTSDISYRVYARMEAGRLQRLDRCKHFRGARGG